MKKYLMLSVFVVFGVSQVTFANINPELEGEWKNVGFACVDFDNNVVSSPVLTEDIAESITGHIKFKSDNAKAGSLDITMSREVPTYQYDYYGYKEEERCNINGTYSTYSSPMFSARSSINATVDMFSASGNCDEDGVSDKLQSLGITASISIGGINYFVESDRLYLASLAHIIMEHVLNGWSTSADTQIEATNTFWEDEEDTGLYCSDNETPALVLEKI